MAALRTYCISGSNLTVANGIATLVFINPSATQGFRVLRAWAAQTAGAAGVQQRIQWSSQVTAFPTLTSATPAKLNIGDAASGITGNTTGAAGTCGINASAEGAGGKTAMIQDTFNTWSGYLWVATPDEQIVFQAGGAAGLGLVLPTAAATLTGWQCGVIYQEI